MGFVGNKAMVNGWSNEDISTFGAPSNHVQNINFQLPTRIHSLHGSRTRDKKFFSFKKWNTNLPKALKSYSFRPCFFSRHCRFLVLIYSNVKRTSFQNDDDKQISISIALNHLLLDWCVKSKRISTFVFSLPRANSLTKKIFHSKYILAQA